jgi:molybdate transport system substrate-binding protein
MTLRILVAALALLGSAAPSFADTITLFSSVAIRTVVEDVALRFERETGHKVAATFGLAAALKGRVEKGDAYDIAILTPAQIDDLIAQGKAAKASRVVIARTGLGFMVRTGAPKLDVGTLDAFKRTLLEAQSLTYAPAGASGVAFQATLKQLGLAEAVAAKTRTPPQGQDMNSTVTSGAVQMAVLPVSEILPVPGAALGGVFPAEAQTYIVMAGATSNTASDAARAFLARLMAASSDAVVTAKGMERVRP